MKPFPLGFSFIRRFSNITLNEAQDIRKTDGFPSQFTDTTLLVDSLLEYTNSLVDRQASNMIAFSGGVDSSLVAALVHHVFHNPYSNTIHSNQTTGSLRAVLGVSASLPPSQLTLARSVAHHIGIDLTEVPTKEGLDPTYIENKGQSCFICKNHLYSALEAVASQVEIAQDNHNTPVLLFNGTNAEDVTDPTRLGILAAKAFAVRSPLEYTRKEDVRRASRHLGLINWNYAASPCLRSRLAWGVEATSDHLLSVNKAEQRIRDILSLDVSVNLRVRMLSGKRAMIEMDPEFLSSDFYTNVERTLRNNNLDTFLRDLGFHGGFSGIRSFASGAVSKPVSI